MENTYSAMKKRHQEECNAFPMICAFNPVRLEERMSELGVERVDELCAIGDTGLFIRLSDKESYLQMCERHRLEEREALKSSNQFAYQMFSDALESTDFGWSEDDADALEELNISREEIEADPVLNQAFQKAKEKIHFL